MRFLKCMHCGNIVEFVKVGGGTVTCCGDPMTELVPNTTDAAEEKHVPGLTEEKGKVKVVVGSVPHPMEPDHYIEWIALETEQGYQRKDLKPGMKPEAEFAILSGDKVKNVYAYCNKHGLWKA